VKAAGISRAFPPAENPVTQRFHIHPYILHPGLLVRPAEKKLWPNDPFKPAVQIVYKYFKTQLAIFSCFWWKREIGLSIVHILKYFSYTL